MPQPWLELLWVNITDCLLGLGKTPVPHESHTQCCLSWLPDLRGSTARCWCNGCWCGTFKAMLRSIREGNLWWSVNNGKWEKMQQQHKIWIKICQKLKTSNSGRIWTKYVIQVSRLPSYLESSLPFNTSGLRTHSAELQEAQSLGYFPPSTISEFFWIRLHIT